MARNGSGTMSLTTTFVAETDALAEDVNAVLEDIADEITNSLAVDGQSSMTGVLRIVDGSAAAPGVVFASDTDTGIYRIGSNSFGLSANGALVATVNSSGITLASGKTLAFPTTGSGLVPAGAIVMWSGSVASIPSGWFLCNGSNGTPDLRDKFIIGARQDDSGTAKTNVEGSLTQSGGTKDATNVAHTHTASSASSGAHTHDTTFQSCNNISGGGGRELLSDASEPLANATATYTTASNGAHTHTITVDSAGSSGTNANLPPYYALAFIMKA